MHLGRYIWEMDWLSNNPSIFRDTVRCILRTDLLCYRELVGGTKAA